MGGDDGGDDRQTETGALPVAAGTGPGGVGPVEALEDAALFARG
jgi:hypothetical protein